MAAALCVHSSFAQADPAVTPSASPAASASNTGAAPPAPSPPEPAASASNSAVEPPDPVPAASSSNSVVDPPPPPSGGLGPAPVLETTPQPLAREMAWTLGASVRGTLGTFVISAPGFALNTNVRGLRGSATGSRYLSPLRDDNTHRALQAFLQRASWVSVGLLFGGWTTDNPYGSSDLNTTYALATASADVYLMDAFAVTGSLGYGAQQSDFDSDRYSERLSIALGAAVRFDNTRIDLTYNFTAADEGGGLDVPNWGNMTVRLTTLVGKSVGLYPWGRFTAGGGGGGANVAFYFGQNVAFWLAGYGLLEKRDDTYPTKQIEYGGEIGASFWLLPTMLGFAEYDIDVSETADWDSKEEDHSVTLGTQLRF